jgi:cytochrome c biogenesis protein CcmG, thiol:disulfide interchange protein DsbE
MTPRRTAIVVVAILLGAACTSDPPEPPADGRVPADNASQAPLLPASADELPAMDPPTFERLLRQLEGTPVLVNFWGSWCPPCREEMPRLVAAHHEYGDRVQFIGVDVLDSRAEAIAFMDEFDMTFPSVFDPPDEIKTALGLLGQPVTVFYDRDGRFVRSWAGPIPAKVLQRNLRAIAD